MDTTTSAGPAIELTGLSKHFGDFVAVDDLTVTVEPGGVIGLLGPNGAGKSTTIRMLLGLIAPSGGSGRVLGGDVTHPSSYMSRVGALVEQLPRRYLVSRHAVRVRHTEQLHHELRHLPGRLGFSRRG